MPKFKPGDPVKARRDIIEETADDRPGEILARAGDRLIVQYDLSVRYRNGIAVYPYYVSHPDMRPDESFGVTTDAIKEAER